MNLADPPPNWGWRCAERSELATRAQPDLVLCLALIHHLVITANIPMAELLDWLADLGASLIIEYVSRNDQQVQKMLLNKVDQYHDYSQESLEFCLEKRFEVSRKIVLGSGNRTPYLAYCKPQ